MTEKEILRLITRPETDNVRVLRLAAEHNTDLPDWCAHRRRRHRLVTDAVIAASVIAYVVITTLPDADGHYISDTQARTETLNNIDQTLFASL
jgi:hypothetical protein